MKSEKATCLLSQMLSWIFCQRLNLLGVCVHLELSCGKSSMSDVLIPGRQTTDFTVSFWDYPDFRSILDIPILIEMCGHMFKCQRMSLQSKQ